MVLDRFSDVSVSFFFTGPAPLFGVGLQCSDVGELVGQASTTRLRPTTTPKPPPPKKTPAVVLRSDLAFGFDSAKVSGRARAAVIRLARQSRAANLTGTIVVEGFTDNLGSAAHGRRLSQQRADAVAAILREYLRGTSLRVIADGLGEANPVRSNATAAGRSANRRVTITLPVG